MALSKPAAYSRWNTGGANRTEPSSGKKDLGWEVDEEPSSAHFNWLMHYVGLWDQWLDERMDDGNVSGGGDEEDLYIHPPPNAASGVGGGLYLQAGAANTSGQGGLLSLEGGDAAGSNQGAGTVDISTGFSRGTGAGIMNFKVAEGGGSGTGINAAQTYIQLDGWNERIECKKDVLVESGADLTVAGGVTTGTDSTGTAYGIIGRGEAGSGGIGGGLIGNGSGTGAECSSTTGYAATFSTDVTSPARAAIRLIPQDSDPSSPQEGDVYSNDTINGLKYYDGTSPRLLHPLRQIFGPGEGSSDTITNTVTKTTFQESAADIEHVLRGPLLYDNPDTILKSQAFINVSSTTGSPDLSLGFEADGSNLHNKISFNTLSGNGYIVLDLWLFSDGTNLRRTVKFDVAGNLTVGGSNHSFSSINTVVVSDTVDEALTLTAQWSAADASNTVALNSWVTETQ